MWGLVMIITICGQDWIARLMHLYKIRNLQLGIFCSNLLLETIMAREEQVERNLPRSYEGHFSIVFGSRKIYALFLSLTKDPFCDSVYCT